MNGAPDRPIDRTPKRGRRDNERRAPPASSPSGRNPLRGELQGRIYSPSSRSQRIRKRIIAEASPTPAKAKRALARTPTGRKDNQQAQEYTRRNSQVRSSVRPPATFRKLLGTHGVPSSKRPNHWITQSPARPETRDPRGHAWAEQNHVQKQHNDRRTTTDHAALRSSTRAIRASACATMRASS